MGTGNAEVCHSDHTAGDDCHALHLIGIVRNAPNIGTETVIDLLGDLINPWQKAFVEFLAPAFQRLFHNRVICISNGFGNQIPSVIPAVAALVQHDPHQFRDRHGGVRIVDMDCNLFRQIIQRIILG